MAKATFLIADTDSTYLAPIEMKFLEEFGDSIDLEIITKTTYFEEYFSYPRDIDVLIISENLYSDTLKKHNIGSTVLLTENRMKQSDDMGLLKLFKYTNVNEIFDRVVKVSPTEIKEQVEKEKATQTIMFYSAAGGVGKTTLSLALSHYLASNAKRVLYINAERINSFQYLLEDADAISSYLLGELAEWSEVSYQKVKACFKKETFDYLPPFPAELSSINLTFKLYDQIVSAAKSSKEYDFIVVDTDTVFDLDKAELISHADKVCITLKQNRSAVFATNELLKNMNCIEPDKYYFLCNQYGNDMDKTLATMEYYPNFKVSEYINHIHGIEELSIAEIANQEDIKKISYLVL